MVIRTLLLGLLSFPVLAFGPQSSTAAQDWGFDFVETFDGLQDWNLSATPSIGNQYAAAGSTQLARMPKLANGSTSAWGYFSLWSHDGATTHSWIGGTEGGTRQIWRGTKSVSFDLGETAKGPSRLGIHFDDYDDLSVFYMVYIPKENFPTSYIDDGAGGALQGIGVYTEGEPYTYYNSWKFNTFNIGCDLVCEGDGYGKHWQIPHIKQYNYAPAIGLVVMASNGHNSNEGTIYGTAAGSTLNESMSNWFGVEFRLNKNPGDATYQMDVWTYSAQGVAQHVVRDHTFNLRVEAAGLGWDQFFFGGNNSNTWYWGPTMTSHYYVDDLIIDNGAKGQIGPRYFAQILGTPVVLPATPSVPSAITATPVPR